MRRGDRRVRRKKENKKMIPYLSATCFKWSHPPFHLFATWLSPDRLISWLSQSTYWSCVAHPAYASIMTFGSSVSDQAHLLGSFGSFGPLRPCICLSNPPLFSSCFCYFYLFYFVLSYFITLFLFYFVSSIICKIILNLFLYCILFSFCILYMCNYLCA